MNAQINQRINPAMVRVQIAPMPCFCNGKHLTATALNVISVRDDLFQFVQFKYTLYDAHGVYAGEGSYELNGTDEYPKWDASPEGAYTIVAAGIGLDIIQTKSGAIFGG